MVLGIFAVSLFSDYLFNKREKQLSKEINLCIDWDKFGRDEF